MAKLALGKGLSALIAAQPAPAPAIAAVDDSEKIQRVSLYSITPSPLQPRKDFGADALSELVESIRQHGIIQPLIVRAIDGRHELIAGERRWRAAQEAGLNEVPVIIRSASDRDVLELSLIENLQRADLNPIEEAQGYSQLIEQFQLKQEEAAAKVGKSRALVANALRLLHLPPEIQAFVRDGRLSVGHAKVILGLNRAEEQRLAAERIIKQSLNVRQTEDLVAHWRNRGVAAAGAKSASLSRSKETHVADLEHRLQERFGTRVDLRYRRGKGALQIHFYTDDDLQRVLEMIGVRPD